ncbi:MAG: ATPase, T2SS/T4P/T4SS family, partial [Candidatus Saccharimonadales bacterium]
PRRNGKTTTLHSLLQMVNVPSLSIATVEESIEYRIPDASQTRVRPQHGITFYSGLQASLRQDPNIVMISSLADKKTAGLAIQAATGGHLMITGMHADNAPAALAHLQTISDEPFLFAHAMRIVMSQRLVRKLCAHCRQSYIPAREEVAGIEKTFGLTASATRQKVHTLEQQAKHAGIGGSASLHTSTAGIAKLWRANVEGCEACNHTGYRGSVAITEVLEVGNETLQTALLAQTNAATLRKLALKEGFVPLELDGLIKALRGQTTITELLRVLSV